MYMHIMAMLSASPARTTESQSRQAFLERQPTYWLKRAYMALRRRVDAELRPYGITLSQRDALLSVRHEGPMSVMALTERLGLEQSSVSRLVRGLVMRGLLEANEDQTDRRSKLVRLTPVGREVLDSTPGASGIASGILMQGLDDADLEHLIVLLKKVTTYLEAPQLEIVESPTVQLPKESS